jgi:hypothetical protein
LSPVQEALAEVTKARRAETDASAWFWDHGYVLYDLCMADAERHALLLVAIHALDMACACERPDEIAQAGDALVREWKAVVAFMRKRRLAEAAE